MHDFGLERNHGRDKKKGQETYLWHDANIPETYHQHDVLNEVAVRSGK